MLNSHEAIGNNPLSAIACSYMTLKAAPYESTISTSNHMIKREISGEISKSQKMNEENFPQISRINM